MTLGFSLQFPDKSPTMFVQKILHPYGEYYRRTYPDMLPKIHTFRLGSRWRPALTMHMVTGNRTPNRNQFNHGIPELERCKAVQPCMIWHNTTAGVSIAIGAPDTPEQRLLTTAEILLFAANDGFNSVEALTRWFFPKGYDPTAAPLVGQIIHFTNFQY